MKPGNNNATGGFSLLDKKQNAQATIAKRVARKPLIDGQ